MGGAEEWACDCTYFCSHDRPSDYRMRTSDTRGWCQIECAVEVPCEYPPNGTVGHQNWWSLGGIDSIDCRRCCAVNEVNVPNVADESRQRRSRLEEAPVDARRGHWIVSSELRASDQGCWISPADAECWLERCKVDDALWVDGLGRQTG